MATLVEQRHSLIPSGEFTPASQESSGKPYLVKYSKTTPPTNEEEHCLKELKKLIKEDEFVREYFPTQDDVFLMAFVRGKNCDTEKAFKTLRNHVHVVRVKYHKYFQKLSPRTFAYLIDGSVEVPRLCGLLKHTDQKGRRVSVGLNAAFNPRIHKADDLIDGTVVAGLEILHTEDGPKNGMVFITDGAGFGLRHAREFSMSRVYLFLTIFLGAYPVKYEALHILNNNYLFDTFLAIVRQLLPKKLRERIHLHGSDVSSLHKHVPREILPQSFGGLLTDEEAYDTEFEKRLLDKTEYYEKLGQNI